jgi:hypothetical protein
MALDPGVPDPPPVMPHDAASPSHPRLREGSVVRARSILVDYTMSISGHVRALTEFLRTTGHLRTKQQYFDESVLVNAVKCRAIARRTMKYFRILTHLRI